MNPALDSNQPERAKRVEGLRSLGPPSAESAYVFRHALLREAAYQLQLPGDRARLHALALAAIEDACGGSASEPDAPGLQGAAEVAPHPTDPLAAELALHARRAREVAGRDARLMMLRERTYLRRAAEHAGRTCRPAESAAFWRELARLFPDPHRGECHRRSGDMLRMAGRLRDAEEACGRAVEIQQRAGDRWLEALARVSVLSLRRHLRREAQDEQEWLEVITALRDAGDSLSAAKALEWLAGLYHDTGRADAAEARYRESLELLRALGSRRNEAACLANLAVLLRSAGRREESEQVAEQALALHRATGDRRFEGVTLTNLAVLFMDTGRWEAGEATFNAALEIHREVGNRRAEGIALGNLARLRLLSGRPNECERDYKQALAILREVGDRQSEGAHLCGYATALMTLHRPEESLQAWSEGSALLRELGDLLNLGAAEARMREACSREGRAFPEATGARSL